MHIVLTILLLATLLVHGPAEAREYCSGLQNENLLDCWNSLIDKNEAQIQISLAAAKASARKNGADYGLDINEALKQIDQSQTAWRKYVGYECMLQRTAVGNGTDKNQVEMNCMLTKLEDRIREIQSTW